MLFRIVDLHRVWVEGKVFEQDLHKVNSLVGGTLELPGLAKIALDPTSLVTIGSVIDPLDRTLPIVFEVENRKGLIKLGSLGRLDLMSTQIVEGLAVPRQAVLLEENRSVVYVQLEGETFERRVVKTGLEDSEWVQVIEGLEPGERIVTVGAYDVALAGRSTEVPVHGHVH
jgi:multidrug efflux pump subunit AcrA (membrane-fusion protein)